MISTDPALPRSAPGSRVAYRLAMPAAATCVYGIFAVLWHWGPHWLYFDILRFVGIEPFSFPFLDLHAVLAAAECQRQGLDVFLSNPCDALGRPDVYSPLWLALTPAFAGTTATPWAGLSLDVVFIISLTAVLRPRSATEILVYALALLSPMMLFAIERANNDLVVFLLITCAGMLFAASRAYRLCSYALFLVAGLLKYYPLALLTLLARERRRDAAAVGFAIAATLGFFGACFGPELGNALANIPAASYFTDSFSAENLPFGFAEGLGDGGLRRAIGLSLLAILLAVAGARALRTVRLLDRAELDWNAKEMGWLAIGGVLLTTCFFAGQNINYRGVYFLLVMPGLVHLQRSVGEQELRRFCVQMIAVALLLMWSEFFRRALRAAMAPAPGGGLSRPEVFFWIGREVAWWWLIAALAAIVLTHLRQLALAEDAIVLVSRGISTLKNTANRVSARQSR